MPDEPTQPTQPSQPKRGKPVEIPVPERDAVLRDLMKAAPRVPDPPKRDDEDSDRGAE